MEYSDFDLIRGIKSGDRSALDILIRRWYPRIYGYIFKMIGHEQDAYDITQDVFVAMMQNIGSYHPWKKFNSWIFTIAHNKCMDYFRFHNRILSVDTISNEQSNFSPILDDIVLDAISIQKALEKLPTIQREIIVLHYYYQFTVREISQMTKTPLPTVKSRLSSAKKVLSKQLQEEGLP